MTDKTDVEKRLEEIEKTLAEIRANDVHVSIVGCFEEVVNDYMPWLISQVRELQEHVTKWRGDWEQTRNSLIVAHDYAEQHNREIADLETANADLTEKLHKAMDVIADRDAKIHDLAERLRAALNSGQET